MKKALLTLVVCFGLFSGLIGHLQISNPSELVIKTLVHGVDG